MCHTCCNSCSNVTNYTLPVYGKLRVSGNCVFVQLQSCGAWSGTGCSTTTCGNTGSTGTSGNSTGGCGCNCGYTPANNGCDYNYFGCCRRRNATTVVGATSNGETDYYVSRCGSYNTYGTTTGRCGCCYNG